jgi:hypothetical protein
MHNLATCVYDTTKLREWAGRPLPVRGCGYEQVTQAPEGDGTRGTSE